MITDAEESWILERAYVPEHVVSLMAPISKGEPFLADDYLCFAKDNWLIFVGYPLERDFSKTRCEAAVQEAIDAVRPEYLWFIGPEIPEALPGRCEERQSDWYYELDLAAYRAKPGLMRQAEKAAEETRVDISNRCSKEHAALIAEFLKRGKLPPMIRELYHAMPGYVAASRSAVVLSAYDKKDRLAALFIVDLAAKAFAAYVVGCYSRTQYVAHASDLLFREMIDLAVTEHKAYINLGLGVNTGIRRFKEKWGGRRFLAYEFCERRFEEKKKAPLTRLLEGKF
jgi:hypothetical protein